MLIQGVSVDRNKRSGSHSWTQRHANINTTGMRESIKRDWEETDSDLSKH